MIPVWPKGQILDVRDPSSCFMTYAFLEDCDKFTGHARQVPYNLVKISLLRRYQTRFRPVMASFIALHGGLHLPRNLRNGSRNISHTGKKVKNQSLAAIFP